MAPTERSHGGRPDPARCRTALSGTAVEGVTVEGVTVEGVTVEGSFIAPLWFPHRSCYWSRTPLASMISMVRLNSAAMSSMSTAPTVSAGRSGSRSAAATPIASGYSKTVSVR